MAAILIVDDEPRIREALSLLLIHHGHSTQVAGDARTALQLSSAHEIELALLDVTLPDMNGVDLLAQLLAKKPDMLCIFITAYGSIRSAVDAIKLGAFDYLTKPFDNDELLITVRRALEHRRLGRRVVELQQELASRVGLPQILGQSVAVSEVVRNLAKVAQSDATVLIQGESGTGKELAARSVHRHSRRAAGPFVPINCAAIPATLAESELFGVERGAFTDARESRAGRFEQAQGGTLFLDEVGELSLDTQAKLLRVLQEREITRLGSKRATAVDVRVVAATNLDLPAAVKAGKFRDDLFWRLNQFPVTMPPLRERLDDLPLLASFLLDRLSRELNVPTKTLAEDAMHRLQTHNWPGNVRELENVLRYALIVSEGDIISGTHLPGLAAGTAPRPEAAEHEPLAVVVARATEHVERAAIEAALARHRGNRTEAARALGIGRRTLFDKLKRLRLVAADEVEEPME